jgi:hypothetical protein
MCVADGTANWAWICDPGKQPISAWLHRACETAFLERLDAHFDALPKRQIAPPRRKAVQS